MQGQDSGSSVLDFGSPWLGTGLWICWAREVVKSRIVCHRIAAYTNGPPLHLKPGRALSLDESWIRCNSARISSAALRSAAVSTLACAAIRTGHKGTLTQLSPLKRHVHVKGINGDARRSQEVYGLLIESLTEREICGPGGGQPAPQFGKSKQSNSRWKEFPSDFYPPPIGARLPPKGRG